MVETVRRARLPAMQNLVHRARREAIDAPKGRFVLAVCRACGFAWNDAFDPALLRYDERYDNTVPSEVMHEYYDELARYLGQKYLRDGGLVVDIGCGRGAFLQQVCGLSPASTGIGVDPALEQDSVHDRVVLVKDVFRPEMIDRPPSLVVSRHVLEHIAHPVAFLGQIRSGVERHGPTPLFVEVPALEHILASKSFWDFCYEHCNYFTATSLATCLREAGFTKIDVRPAFGSHYLWAESWSGETHSDSAETSGATIADALLEYAAEEERSIAATRSWVASRKAEGGVLTVWGAATKGVLFCLLVDSDAELLDYCVDVNTIKQGCYVPLTGHRIDPPDVLRRVPRDRQLTVVVMNENYAEEIASHCAEMGVEADLVDAHGNAL